MASLKGRIAKALLSRGNSAVLTRDDSQMGERGRTDVHFHSTIGKHFIKYCKEHYFSASSGEEFHIKEEWIPAVDIAIKINSLSEIDVPSGTWTASITVMLDWQDKSLTLGNYADEEICWEDHFVPRFQLSNALSYEVDGDPIYRVKGSQEDGDLRITFTKRYKEVVFQQGFNLRNFPFDNQYLDIRIKMYTAQADGNVRIKASKSKRNGAGKKAESRDRAPASPRRKKAQISKNRGTVPLKNPQRWRQSDGHQVEAKGDQLPGRRLTSSTCVRVLYAMRLTYRSNETTPTIEWWIIWITGNVVKKKS